MKHKLAVLFAALLCAGALIPTPAQAVGVSIEIGDRPYYTRGPWYSRSGTRWYWVSGHWVWRHHHRVWVHGYYEPYRYYYRHW